jgi:hypothetical protein
MTFSCFIFSPSRYYSRDEYRNRTLTNAAGIPSLNYTICVGESLGQIHDFMQTVSQPTLTRQKVQVSRSKMKPKKTQPAPHQVATTPTPVTKFIGRLRNGYVYRPSVDEHGKTLFSQSHMLNLTARLSESVTNHAWIILDHQWQVKRVQ